MQILADESGAFPVLLHCNFGVNEGGGGGNVKARLKKKREPPEERQ